MKKALLLLATLFVGANIGFSATTLFINEILFNPPGQQDDPNEYIEIRGNPNEVIPKGTWLVTLDGNDSDVGGVWNRIPLETNQIGSNGFLVLLQKNHSYSTATGATVLTNSGTEGGWGDGGDSSLGHDGDDGETNLFNASVTFLLIQSDEEPQNSDDADEDNDGILDGVSTNWTILDSVGVLDNGGSPDSVYGYINFRRSGSPGNTARASGTVVEVDFTAKYVGRNGHSTGWSTNDWVASDDLVDNAPNFRLASGSKVYPANRAGADLDHIGASNFDEPYNYSPVVTAVPAISGVVNDPDNPQVTFTITDTETPIGSLTINVVSGDTETLPQDRLSVSGTGSTRTLTITPTNMCYDVPITISADDGTNLTEHIIRYAASTGWSTNVIFPAGMGDGSSAITIDSNYMVLADDETPALRVYDRTRSGLALASFDFETDLGMTNLKSDGTVYEMDLEASTRCGDVIYWVGSHGNGGDGRRLVNRRVLFATQLSGSGTNVLLTLVGQYNHLRSDIINWDAQGLHGKGQFYYGLLDSTGDGHDPKTIDGFNIEGFTMALGEENTNVALVAFRAPLVPLAHRQKALILSVTNLPSLVAGTTNAGSTKFGEPIELDLGGRGIRSIERYDEGYLIVAGPWGDPTGDPYEFRLFTWSGNPDQSPQEMSADLSGLNPEGIVDVPGGMLSSTSRVQIVSDNGTTQWYLPFSDKECKDLPEENFRKCRVDWVTVGDPVAVQNIWSENTAAIRGRFVRGTGTNAALQSYVESLDGIKGVRLDDQGGTAEQYYPGNDWTNTLYHHNADTPSSPISFENPIAAYGTEAGGTPLAVDRTYTFRVGFGDRPRSSVETNNAGFEISVYDRQTFERVTNVVVPLTLDPWSQAEDFSREGIIVDLPQFGLATRFRPVLNDEMDTDGFYISHRAVKIEYAFSIGGMGYVLGTNGPPRTSMVSNQVAAVVSPLYVMAFDRSPAWRSDFVFQPHFDGEPLPSAYAGKTVEELIHYSAQITNQLSVGGDPGSYTNLDASPELRRHSILDGFVQDMGRDPIALANYVQNEIKLVDAFTYNDEEQGETSVNHGGMNRGALATFLEGQGSPLEQCSLLVYLLRQAEVPAVYVFPTHNGMKLLDARLSRLLRCQLRSLTNAEPRLIPVNYPWVAVHDGTNWLHLFPWLKDTEVIEGLDLYDHLPDSFNNGYKWTREYLRMNKEIFQLGLAKDTPAELFPAFVQYNLYHRFPGINLGDIGVKISDRKHHCSRWQDFPRPTFLTNEIFAVESMGVITNTFANLTNVFNTLAVEVSSVTNSERKILTGDLRLMDLHNRRFVLWYEPTNSDHRMILTLESFRPGSTNRYSFAEADAMSPTNTRITHILSMTNVLDASDDTLTIKFELKRYASLSFGTNASSGSLPPFLSRQLITPVSGTDEERVIRKGDLIAICVNPGRISPKMFSLHQEHFDWLDEQATADPLFREQLTPEEYEGLRTYLMGMYYFAGVDRFSRTCEQLHKMQAASWFTMGLAKFGAARDVNDNLPAGAITYDQAILDVFFQELTTVGNGTLHPGREADAASVGDSFFTLMMLNSAAQEHASLDRFFGRTNAISTVTLLQKAMQKTTGGLDFGIIELSKENYLAEGERLFQVGTNQWKLKEFDPEIWSVITNTFAVEGISNSLRAIVPAGFVTNAVGTHFGALLFGGKYFASLLSPHSINGGVANLGEQCIMEVKLYLGNDCQYHLEEWFGDHLTAGDKVVGCTNAPPDAPLEMVVCCEDVDACNVIDPENFSISISDALRALDKYQQRMASREISSSDESSQYYTDFSYNYYLWDPEVFGYDFLSGFTYDSGPGLGPLVEYYYNYFSEEPLTQTEFELLMQITGFVGSERFLDTVGFNHALLADPVNVMTGEFYSDQEDLRMNGPFPLSLRRSYSSRNLANNELGYGWNLNFFPYLTVTHEGDKIYAVEPGGSVVSYRQQGGSTNWLPELADNPELSNQNQPGQAVSANMLTSRLTLETVGEDTYYRLHLPDGSVRKYLGQTFEQGGVESDRPYLVEWADHRGNTHTFFYGEESGANDYGKLRRVQCSSGLSLVLCYDNRGHVTEALSGDGRRVRYFYDKNGEDLTSVLRPDGSRIEYSYERVQVPESVSTIYKYKWTPITLPGRYESRWVPSHFEGTNWITGHYEQVWVPQRVDYVQTLDTTETVTNFISSHRIVREVKPNGRVLRNVYDDSGRVVEQWATVGLDLRPVQNATFIYSNDFVLHGTNAASGFTLIVDALGNTNRYDYTNGLVTKITDSHGHSIVQEWYSETGSGGFARSLKSRTDKRGLTQTFVYDGQGNIVTNTITGADLTGDGLTNAVFSYAYNTNNATNILMRTTDPVGKTMETTYDPVFGRLPRFAVNYAPNETVISTNAFFYTNATTPFSYTTNSSFGLLWRTIKAYGSEYAATNDFEFDGRGLVTHSIRYPSTGDPNVATTFHYNNRGELVEQIDAAGRVTRFDYNERGQITAREVLESSGETDGPPIHWEYSYYNDNGELVWSDGPRFDPEDYVWRDYDGAGRKTVEIRWRSRAREDGTGVEAETGDALYATTWFEYDLFGNQTRAIDPRGNFVVRDYDALARLASETFYSTNGAVLAAQSYGYEPGGQVNRMTNALGGITERTFTSTGQPKFQQNPDGSTNAWTYYLDGRGRKEIQRNGAYWETTYDDANRRVTRVFHSPAGTPLATNITELDRRGNVVRSVDASGNEWTKAFDGLNRIKVESGPIVTNIVATGMTPTEYTTNVMQQVNTYTYDASGTVLTVVNALGETTVATNDALGRVIWTGNFASNGVTPLRVTELVYATNHHGMTMWQGTGGSAIPTTTYTDSYGNEVLSIGYPATGVAEYTLSDYDVAGNLTWQGRYSNTNGTVALWTSGSYSYDGLNRVQSETVRDGATTTFLRDALGNVTSRSMPGGMTWSATYANDGRILTEQDSGGGQTARSTIYSYYGSGHSWAGLLHTVTDGRSVTRTNTYDDWLRLASGSTTGTLDEQKLTLSWSYDVRGLLTNVTQSFASTNTGPSTIIRWGHNAYGQVTNEQVTVGGATHSGSQQAWDGTGRRASLSLGNWVVPFGYRADGRMTSAGEATFGYGNNGLLTGRTNTHRTFTITSRDGTGRRLQTATTVGASTPLSETLSWRGNGLLSGYTATRTDFTDTRHYAYADGSQRLIQESLYLGASQPLTNAYAYDHGTSGGLGVLTAAAQSSSELPGQSGVPSTGGLDGLKRVVQSTNTIVRRTARGTVNGPAFLSAELNDRPISVRHDSSLAGQWLADVELVAGTNTLEVTAQHPSLQFDTNATSSFTLTNKAADTLSAIYDGNGSITQRIWKNYLGQTNRTQTLTWDAFNRLVKVTERDAQTNGFNWRATFDGLGRRVQTLVTLVSNGTETVSATLTHFYDPQVEFLEIGVGAGGVITWKLYGPDGDGGYGSQQGLGGLEVLAGSSSTGIIQDHFGNVLAGINSGSAQWIVARVSSYGPVEGTQLSGLAFAPLTADHLGWRGKWKDVTGDFYWGARPYDPVRRVFGAFDPFGHSAAPGGYSAFDGTPTAVWDPDARLGKGNFVQYNPLTGDINSFTAYDAFYLGMDQAMGGETLLNDPFVRSMMPITDWPIEAFNGQSFRMMFGDTASAFAEAAVMLDTTFMLAVPLSFQEINDLFRDAGAASVNGSGLEKTIAYTRAAVSVPMAFLVTKFQANAFTHEFGVPRFSVTRTTGPSRNVVEFEGMEVRAVRDLSHLDKGTLEAMQQQGFAPTTINGKPIVLHHLNQNVAGPLVEMPRLNNNVWNTVQHPLGNRAGAGLTQAQRAAYDAWRFNYWKWRATQELNVRRVLGE